MRARAAATANSTVGDVGVQEVGDVDVKPRGADQRTSVIEHPIPGDNDAAGASGGVDDAVPAAERLALHHPVQHGGGIRPTSLAVDVTN